MTARSLLLALIALLPFEPAGAREVEIELVPVGNLRGAQVDQMSPFIDPVDILTDLPEGASLDIDGPPWRIRLDDLTRYRTQLKLSVGAEDRAFPATPLNVSLPYRQQKPLRIVVPFLDKFDNRHIRSVFEDETLSSTADDHLTDFIQATMKIDFLTEGRIPRTDDMTPNLARTLLVYANSMTWLVENTDWFGVPSDFETKREMMKRAIIRARNDPRYTRRAAIARLQGAKERAERARFSVYRRYFAAIADLRGEIQCNEIFPISLPFYEHLRELPRADYDRVRSNARFTRSQVLNETVRCFDLLLGRRDGARMAAKVVQERKFGGRDASEMRSLLARYLDDERRNVIREAGGVPASGGPCLPPDVTSTNAIGALRAICADIAWLDALAISIEKGVRNESN